MQQFLKPTAGAAWAWVIATQLLDQLLVSVHNAMTALDPGFGWEAPATLTRDLETETGRGAWSFVSWHTSALETPRFGAAHYSDRAPVPMAG
jgi:hypothetical protein